MNISLVIIKFGEYLHDNFGNSILNLDHGLTQWDKVDFYTLITIFFCKQISTRFSNILLELLQATAQDMLDCSLERLQNLKSFCLYFQITKRIFFRNLSNSLLATLFQLEELLNNPYLTSPMMLLESRQNFYHATITVTFFPHFLSPFKHCM